MERGLRAGAHERVEFLVGLAVCTRVQLAAAIAVERGLPHDLARRTDRIAEFAPVERFGHVVEQDARMVVRIARAQLHAAAARRAHRADVRLEAVHLDRVRAVVVDRNRQEVILDVRPQIVVARADETARLEVVARAEAGAIQHPFEADLRLVPPLERRVQRDRLLALVLDIHLQVILQVLADTGQVEHDGNVEFLQPRTGADARALQQLRRRDRAAAHEHFAARMRGRTFAAAQVRDARRALAVEQDAIGERVRDDLEVRPHLRLVEVAARGAGAAALRRDGAVHRAEAFLLIAVQIIRARIAGLHTCIDHGLEQRVHARLAGRDRHGAAAAVIVVRADVARFGLLEVRQAVEIRPVIEALVRRPVVVVERVAADVAHAVDQRRAAGFLPRPHSIRRLSMCGSGSVS